MATIRALGHDDFDAVLDIVNRIIAHGDAFCYETPFSSGDMQKWIESHLACFVAVDEKRVLGGYVLRPNLPGRSSHIANASYFVDEETRGCGVGLMLGKHSLEEAKRLGFTAMQFNAVVASNAGAVRLWESLGFETIGRSPRAFRRGDGKKVDLLIMHRRI